MQAWGPAGHRHLIKEYQVYICMKSNNFYQIIQYIFLEFCTLFLGLKKKNLLMIVA